MKCPGFEMVMVRRDFESLLVNKSLYLIKESKVDLEMEFEKYFTIACDKIIALRKEESERKKKIAEAKKILEENPE